MSPSFARLSLVVEDGGTELWYLVAHARTRTYTHPIALTECVRYSQRRDSPQRNPRPHLRHHNTARHVCGGLGAIIGPNQGHDRV